MDVVTSLRVSDKTRRVLVIYSALLSYNISKSCNQNASSNYRS